MPACGGGSKPAAKLAQADSLIKTYYEAVNQPASRPADDDVDDDERLAAAEQEGDDAAASEFRSILDLY
ncbi:hypothetical protein Y032_0109g102 [Ancylostoma ceylanicum]|uniref:Uncharacterized protein n=1 Tax=Ancylostoma ceylanicum TaxID=53326 RepID=A0A016TEZ0_9BILA|nr:hypothetical protein Y032_0109g102 [Ancylostoma ceylanicum]